MGDDDWDFVSPYSIFMHTWATVATSIAASLLLASGLSRCEALFHVCGASPVCLFYAISIVFQLYHGGDI